jgi:hypothetical protein
MRWHDVLTAAAIVGGTLLLIAASLYRRFWHPEWTGGHALATLWPFYLSSASMIVAGWVFKDARDRSA